MKLFPLLLAALVIPASAVCQTKTLADLEQASKQIDSRDPYKDNDKRIQLQEDLRLLIESDALKSGEEFRRAAALVPYINARFEQQRMRYELTMIAMTLGDAQ